DGGRQGHCGRATGAFPFGLHPEAPGGTRRATPASAKGKNEGAKQRYVRERAPRKRLRRCSVGTQIAYSLVLRPPTHTTLPTRNFYPRRPRATWDYVARS